MDKYNHWIGKLVGKLNNNPRYAITLWQTSYFSVAESEVGESWHKHEDCHKRQWKTYGSKFLFMYLWESFKNGYTKNTYEIEAVAESGL